MHYFVTDETNNGFVSQKFFIYGGLVFTDEQFVQTHHAVESIREKHGFQRGDSFKFHTHSRPAQVSIANAKLAKKELVEKLEELGIRMIVYVILHDIAQAQTDEVRTNWALNTVTWAYHRLLERENAGGLFLMDREDAQHQHHGRLFQHGTMFQGRSAVPVDDRILMYGMTSDGASHISSAVDIAIGGFRYCVNAAGGDGSEVVAADIFPPISRIIWGIEVGDTKYLRNYGFHSMPKTAIRQAEYRERYAELYSKLDEYSGSNSEDQVEAPDSPKAGTV